MGSGRAAKRARQKERRSARRKAIQHVVRRRRRQRLLLLGVSVLLIGGGLGIVFLARDTGETPQPADDPDTTEALAAPTPQPVACGAELPQTAGAAKDIYPAPTEDELDPDRTHILRLETSCGVVDIELDVASSPRTAASVAFLARRGFYDGLVFHRIVPGFVIQGGDPRGDGTGGAGYQVVEPPPENITYTAGVVAMAKTGNDPPGTSGSQFFIVSGPDAEGLPGEYAYLGRVVEGMDVVEEIEALGGDAGGAPSAWAYIERATIVEE